MADRIYLVRGDSEICVGTLYEVQRYAQPETSPLDRGRIRDFTYRQRKEATANEIFCFLANVANELLDDNDFAIDDPIPLAVEIR